MQQRLVTVFIFVNLLVAGTLVVGGTAHSDKKEKHGKAEMVATAKATISEAVKTASEQVSGTIIEAALEMDHNKLVWEVGVVTAENKVMEVHIDAESGAVIDVEEEKAKTKQSHKWGQKP